MGINRVTSRKLLWTFLATVLGVTGLLMLHNYVRYRENIAAVSAIRESRNSITFEHIVSTALQAPYDLPACNPPEEFQVVLTPSKVTYRLGDEVGLRILIANCGSRTLLLPGTISLPEQSLHLRVRRNGVPVRGRSLSQSSMGIEYPCQIVVLHPGEVYGTVVSLSRGDHAFDVSQSGSYRVECDFTVLAAMAEKIALVTRSNCLSASGWGDLHAWSGVVGATPVPFQIE